MCHAKSKVLQFGLYRKRLPTSELTDGDVTVFFKAMVELWPLVGYRYRHLANRSIL